MAASRTKKHDARVTFPVEVQCEGDSGARRYLALNLDPGGLFLRTVLPLPPGTRLTCAFSVPGADASVTTRGEVAWTRPRAESLTIPAGMGVRFLRLKAEYKEIIASLAATPTPA
jgi:uncharacterized protein (TIGR02266 family)